MTAGQRTLSLRRRSKPKFLVTLNNWAHVECCDTDGHTPRWDAAQERAFADAEDLRHSAEMVDGWKSGFTREATTRREPTSSAPSGAHAARNIFNFLEAPHNAMVRFAKKHWGLSALLCAPFQPLREAHGHSGIWATSSFLHCKRMRLHGEGTETDRICLCLQSPPGARERTNYSASPNFFFTGAVERNLAVILACCSHRTPQLLLRP